MNIKIKKGGASYVKKWVQQIRDVTTLRRVPEDSNDITARMLE